MRGMRADAQNKPTHLQGQVEAQAAETFEDLDVFSLMDAGPSCVRLRAYVDACGVPAAGSSAEASAAGAPAVNRMTGDRVPLGNSARDSSTGNHAVADRHLVSDVLLSCLQVPARKLNSIELRRFRMDDADFVRACSDRVADPQMRWSPLVVSSNAEAAENWIRLADGNGADFNCDLCIADSSSAPLGCIGIRGYDDGTHSSARKLDVPRGLRTVEAHYWLAKTARGSGVVSTALLCLLEAVQQGPFFAQQCMLSISKGNQASVRVAEKCGFSSNEQSQSWTKLLVTANGSIEMMEEPAAASQADESEIQASDIVVRLPVSKAKRKLSKQEKEALERRRRAKQLAGTTAYLAHTRTSTCMHARMHSPTHPCVLCALGQGRTCMHACTHARIPACTRACIHACLHHCLPRRGAQQ